MDPHPSFFELAFALALLHFREAKAGCAVIETGLGGRLDATNVLSPDVSVITRIGLDHQQWLGDTLAEIAAEKAGIIKPGVPIITAPQDPAALAVIKEHAARLSAPLTIIDQKDYPPASALGLIGEHQRENAALATAALAAGGFEIPASALAHGLGSANWPARFQILTPSEFPAPIIVDGAHNHDAARILAQTWRAQFPGKKATLIYSAVEGKAVSPFLSELLPLTAHIILTKSHSSRARHPQDLRAELEKALPLSPGTTIAESPADALAEAKKLPPPILVTGSLFLAGDILALLQSTKSPDPSEKL